MLDNSKWSKGNEKFVLATRDYLITQALGDGKNVIIDDTNLNPIHEQHIQELFSHLAEIVIKDFTNIPIEECITRDLKRQNSVGERVIRDTYNKWIRKNLDQKDIAFREYDPLLQDIVISDLDGTIALFGNKNPYNRDFENDDLNPVVANILSHYSNIIFVSGREEKYRGSNKSFS